MKMNIFELDQKRKTTLSWETWWKYKTGKESRVSSINYVISLNCEKHHCFSILSISRHRFPFIIFRLLGILEQNTVYSLL